MNKLDFLKLSKEQVELNPYDGPAKYLNTLRKSNNANEKTIAGNQDTVTSTQDKPKLSTQILGTLKNIAKDPSTYSKLASVASVVAAAEGENTAADALSNISSRIDQNVRSRDTAKATVEAERIAAEAEAEKERLKLEVEEPKRQADIALKKAQEQYSKSQKNKLDLETDLLRNPDPDPKKVFDLENAKLTNRKLLLDINKLENPEDLGAKKNSEIYNAAYQAYINKINDPKEITFRKRLQQSDNIIKEFEKTSFGDVYIPNFAGNKKRQFKQAEENFINAQLRRESGASIAESEFENARQIYLPVIGDSAEVLEQKRKARALLFAIPEFIDPTKIIKQVDTQTKTQDESVSQPEQMDNKTLLKLGGY